MPERQEKEPTQATEPHKGEPLEIPMPKREDVMRDLKKVARPASGKKRSSK